MKQHRGERLAAVPRVPAEVGPRRRAAEAEGSQEAQQHSSRNAPEHGSAAAPVADAPPAAEVQEEEDGEGDGDCFFDIEDV